MKKWPIAGLMALFALLLMWQLGTLNVTIMEARNFVTAREMVQEGNYFIPTLNEEYRLQKPPLPTWMTALVIALTGSLSEFWLRIPAVFMGLLALLYSMKIVRFTSDEKIQSGLTGVILVSSFYFFLAARSGMWDIFAQAFTLLAIYHYMLFFRQSRASLKHALIIGFCLAASFMSKGPVALYGLLLPFLVAYHVLFRQTIIWSRTKWYYLTIAVVVALLGSFSWPVFIYFSEAGSAAAAIAKEESQNWSNYNVKPFYHYWSFPIQSGVWTLFGFAGLGTVLLGYKKYKSDPALMFYFWWTILVVVFLSIIPEKKERYLLPVLFPLAMFLSEIFQQPKSDSLHKIVRVISFITALCLAAVSFILLFNLRPEIANLEYRSIGGFALLFGSGLALFLAFRDMLSKFALVIGGSIGLVVLFFISDIGHIMNSTDAQYSFRQFSTDPLLRELPLYAIGEIRPELIWYIGRKAPMLKSDYFPTNADTIGVFSDIGVQKEVDPKMLVGWRIIQEKRYNQNPKVATRKPNQALARYCAILTRIKSTE